MASRLNLLEGNVKNKMIAFATPLILSHILQQVYQLTDMVIVGRFIGESALAAVGACTPFVFLFISLAKGIGMGASIVVSQNYGRGNKDNVRKTCESIYLFMIITSLIAMCGGLYFSSDIMRLMNLPEELIPQAVEYFNIYLLCLPFLFLFNSVTGLLSGVGDSVTPLKFIFLSAILNIALDLLFIVVLDFGVAGTAWATVISQATALLLTFIYINKKVPIVRFVPHKAKVHKKLFLESIRLGVPTGIQQIFVSVGMIALMYVINGFGVDVIAGYVAALRIEQFVMVIPMNLATALTAFVAQNYGASQLDRIDKGIRESIKLISVICFVILMLLSVFGGFLMQLFTDNEQVIEIGNQYLFIIGLSFILFSIMFVYTGAMRGVGNTIFPMLVTLLCFCFLKVPLAYLLSEWIGVLGIWLATPISWFVSMLISIIYWYGVQWKKITIRLGL